MCARQKPRILDAIDGQGKNQKIEIFLSKKKERIGYNFISPV
jgi:hypothetical protein